MVFSLLRRAARRAVRDAARLAKKSKARRGSTSDGEGEDSDHDNVIGDDFDDEEDEFSSEAESVSAPPPVGSALLVTATAHSADAATPVVSATPTQQLSDKLCISLAMSVDGSLAVAGCTDRVLSVCDAARPGCAPLAQVGIYSVYLLSAHFC